MGLRTGEKAHMLSFRNRIEVIPVRDIRSLRGYLKGIDTCLFVMATAYERSRFISVARLFR
jgi:hypothetical protein